MSDTPVPDVRLPESGASPPVADAVLEAYGQTCVTLEPLIKRHMRGMVSGQILEVRCDDPTARLGVPSWSRLSGNRLIAVVEEDQGRTRFYLRRK
jgi:TusA-related sulfurtransferase